MGLDKDERMRECVWTGTETREDVSGLGGL